VSEKLRSAGWILAGLLVLCGCASAGASPSPTAPIDAAAAEATAIIQRAQATAMVLQAQVQATQLIQNASAPTATPVLPAPSPAPPFTPMPNANQPTATPPSAVSPRSDGAQAAATLPPAPAQTAEGESAVEEDESAVELVGVTLGTESGLIMVQFKAPPQVARQWQQGNVYLTDEATGTIYNEVPVAPIVGPLFARPKYAGQLGYVMFVNPGNSLREGALVTVVLGKYKQEHVTVK